MTTARRPHGWQLWCRDDDDKHDGDAANFWPTHVVAVVFIGIALTLVLPRWAGHPLAACALIAPIHIAMHFVTSRPGIFARAPRLVSSIENLTNLALTVAIGVLGDRPNPLLWLIAAGFVVIIGLAGRPAVVFAVAAATMPVLGTALRLLVDGAPLDPAAFTLPVGASFVLCTTYVFVAFIRAGWAREDELRRREEQARVVEAERQRIARELHDDVGATLAEINLWLGIAQRGVQRGSDNNHDIDTRADALAVARERAHACSARLRALLVPLREGTSTIGATTTAIEQRVRGLADAGQVEVVVDVDAAIDGDAELDGVVAHSLQMFALEATSNAIRHGGAAHIVVRVRLDHGAVCIEVVDDGRGFDVAAMLAANRLLSLRARATACEARFFCVSRAGETRVALVLP